jgi:hypothetical protein
MAYIHDLSLSLIRSKSGAKVRQTPCGAILQADDIALAALTPAALQDLVTICEQYSYKWRFNYNPIKSKVLVFGKSVKEKHKKNCGSLIKLYNRIIDEVNNYTHVGVNLYSDQDTTERSIETAARMRGCFMSILGQRLNFSEISCMTAIKLYNTIVLPRSLYGAEVWYKLTKQDVTKFEIAHRFCLKRVQSLPKRSRSVIVHSMVKIWSIESYIDNKKLLFLGRLCRLSSKTLAKQVFLEMLYAYKTCNSTSGCVYNFCCILSKYELYDYINTFLNQTFFPSKNEWRKIVTNAVWAHDRRVAHGVMQDPSLSRFVNVYGDLSHVHPVWLAEQ